tara:strand:+ start:2457 stop:3176 length:720 start_codon:yes stop_codon:yes gene_type:complete
MPNAHHQPVIAIDGTSASGKSTLSERLARDSGAARLEYSLVFRSIAWHMVNECGFDPDGEPTAEHMAQATACALAISEMPWDDFSAKFHDNPDLYTLEISRATPFFSGQQSVIDIADPAFAGLIDRCPRPVVAEGRTIGRYTYPWADVKFYVDATLYKRAERRHASLKEKGKEEAFEIVLADLAHRDHQDQTRDYQPTTFDPGAQFWMNTTTQKIEDTLAQAKHIICAQLISKGLAPIF